MVPYYFKPLLTYCKLPGGLRYLNVVKPGPQTPLETAMSDSDYVYKIHNLNYLFLPFLLFRALFILQETVKILTPKVISVYTLIITEWWRL